MAAPEIYSLIENRWEAGRHCLLDVMVAGCQYRLAEIVPLGIPSDDGIVETAGEFG